MPTVAEIVHRLDEFAPPDLAAEWDNVGLLLGDGARSSERVMTCLTITPEVVAEGLAERVQLIVSHHPVLFRGVKNLSSSTAEGRLLLPLLRNGIAVYSPHTAFDNCVGGINDQLCTMLGLTTVRPLRPKPTSLLKLVVFLPEGDLAKVSDAVFAAGAGFIGRYDQCSYRVTGIGTFFGQEGTNPTIGRVGRREEVHEWRLEVILPANSLGKVVSAVRASHSYEEPAFDVYPLHFPTATGDRGEGRLGELPTAVPLGDFAQRAKVGLRAAGVQVVGDLAKPVTLVAVACGAAGEFLSDAIAAQADVFLTGELRFHDGLAAQAAGIGAILPGHYATERPAVEALVAKLQTDFPSVTVWSSRAESDPFAVL